MSDIYSTLTIVYVLQHPSPTFSGQYGPISWSNGIGSTSNKADRDWAVNVMGATDVTDQYPPETTRPNGAL